MSRTLVIIGLALIVSSSAYAAGDAKAGARKIEVCAGCHGENGQSMAGNFPNLAAQHASYIEKQLTELKSGARKDATMSPMAADVKTSDIADIAAYFASQPPAPAEGAGTTRPDVLQRGKQLFKGGDRYKEVPACMSCHSPTGAGNPQARYPRLAGQHAEYIVIQLKKFKTGERANDHNKMMREIASRMSNGDINAVAAFIATLPSN